MQPSGQPVDERDRRHERDADHEVAEPLDLETDREAGDTERAERRHQQGHDDLADGSEERLGRPRGEHGQAGCEHSRCRGGPGKQRRPLPEHGGNTDGRGEQGRHGRRSAGADGESDGEQDAERGRQRLVCEHRRIDDSHGDQTACDTDQSEDPRRLQCGRPLRAGAWRGWLLVTGEAASGEVLACTGGSFA